MTSGQIGNALTHALIYKQIVDSGHRGAVILEDDAILTPSFVDLYTEGYFDQTDEKLIVLHCYRRAWASRSPTLPFGKTHRLYRFYGQPLGTCGFYLNTEAARELLEASLPIWTHTDWPLDISKALDAKGIEPPCIIHGEDVFHSQIQTFRTRRTPLLVRLGRLAIAPCYVFPRTFGSPWKAYYAWHALIFQAKGHLFARKPLAPSQFTDASRPYRANAYSGQG